MAPWRKSFALASVSEMTPAPMRLRSEISKNPDTAATTETTRVAHIRPWDQRAALFAETNGWVDEAFTFPPRKISGISGAGCSGQRRSVHLAGLAIEQRH